MNITFKCSNTRDGNQMVCGDHESPQRTMSDVLPFFPAKNDRVLENDKANSCGTIATRDGWNKSVHEPCRESY